MNIRKVILIFTSLIAYNAVNAIEKGSGQQQSTQSTPEEQLIANSIDINKYIKIIEDSPARYGETSTQVKHLREHFERQPDDYKSSPLKSKRHPYKELNNRIYGILSTVKNTPAISLKEPGPDYIFKNVKDDIDMLYDRTLPIYMKNYRERYNLVD